MIHKFIFFVIILSSCQHGIVVHGNVIIGELTTTTAEPTTAAPIVAAPIFVWQPILLDDTVAEITASPTTTSAPTTSAPTTSAPATSAPTTQPPTVAPTVAPTTAEPTAAPTTSPSSPTIIPLILLAGQSNMQGFSDQAGLFYTPSEKGLSLQNLLPQLLRPSNNDREKFQAIRSVILKVENPNVSTATTEANLLLDLQRRYPTIFNDIIKPNERGVYCYYESFEAYDVTQQDPTLLLQRPQDLVARPLQAITERKHSNRCGEPWGLEVTLGHTLKLSSLPNNDNNNMSLVKFAAGNTNLFRHWSRYYDECIEPNAWSLHIQQLLSHNRMSQFHPLCDNNNNNCRWSAIVWFQGESDTFESLEAEKYAERLPRFLNHLREEMFQNQKTVRF